VFYLSDFAEGLQGPAGEVSICIAGKDREHVAEQKIEPVELCVDVGLRGGSDAAGGGDG
jgi:hypothetical protein